MANNIVIRKCEKCYCKGEDGDGFSYRGDGVWSCSWCGSMWTHVHEIIDPDKKETK